MASTSDFVPEGTIPQGGIILWSGSTDSIPSGWALCDGNNGTPNLTDRFVIGAGNDYNVDSTGDGSIPSHNHDDGSLSADSHSHGDGSLSVKSHSHGDGSLSTSTNGDHGHSVKWRKRDVYDLSDSDQKLVHIDQEGTENGWIVDNGDHSHGVSGRTGSSSPNVSGRTGNSSPNVSGRTGDTGSGSEVIAKYYALAYIMKI